MKLRVAVLLPLIGLFLFASRKFVLDDGLIYARFLANALAGHGLVFNIGESVNSLTSPLFTYLLLGVSWLTRGNIPLAEHIVFAFALLGVCILAERLVPYSGLAIASTAYFYLLIGLETSLFLFMIMLSVKLYADRSYDWLPVVLVLTCLTRFEGGLLVLIVGYRLWREKRYPRAIAFVPAAIICLVYVLLNYHWYGSLLPNSASSKFGQAMSGYWGRWPTAFLRFREWAFQPRDGAFRWTMYVIPLILVFGIKGWRRMQRTREHEIIAPFFVGLLSFYILANMPDYHWYYAPLIFIAIVYAVKGVPETRVGMWALATVLLVSGTTNYLFLKSRHPVWDYVNVARWLNDNTPENARISTVEIGQIGWATNRNIIDILGLTCPKNAAHIAHRDVTSWLNEDKPDYIIVHKPLWRFEVVTSSHPEYREVPFHSGNVYILQRQGELAGGGYTNSSACTNLAAK